ncbi:MAG TPA: hypothetical protein VMZ91_11560 [Candidatus Paceibacterota bacterium]|nr:hypothetical protein [Candidatus Paceibacterota bacterium]
MRQLKGIEKYLGLMFRTRNTEPVEFLFDKETQVPFHSLFVFFDFMCYWYDSKGELIQSRLCKPFELNIRCNTPFMRIIEVPRILKRFEDE